MVVTTLSYRYDRSVIFPKSLVGYKHKVLHKQTEMPRSVLVAHTRQQEQLKHVSPEAIFTLYVHLLGHQSSPLSNELSIHILYYFQSPPVLLHMQLTVHQVLVLRPSYV
jgi:hypothetical protein